MKTISKTSSHITEQEFKRRVKHNTELFRTQSELNNFTPSLYYLWDKEPQELTSLQYGRLFHDIYAAAITGTLAIADPKDHDSMLIRRGKKIKVELKTSYIDTKDVFQSKFGKIYVYGSQIIDTALCASFNGNPPEDDMLVYLICCDASGKWDTDVIGVWQMEGETAIRLLDLNKKKITLRRFREFGKQKRVEVNTIGWSSYIKTLKKRLPISRIITAH